MGGTLAAQAPAPTAPPPPPPPLRLSFADAGRLASGEVPVVALASLRATEADARVRQARAALLPSASVGGFWLNRTFNSRSIGISFPGFPELIGPFNNYDARVSATQADRKSTRLNSSHRCISYAVFCLKKKKKKK